MDKLERAKEERNKASRVKGRRGSLRSARPGPRAS